MCPCGLRWSDKTLDTLARRSCGAHKAVGNALSWEDASCSRASFSEMPPDVLGSRVRRDEPPTRAFEVCPSHPPTWIWPVGRARTFRRVPNGGRREPQRRSRPGRRRPGDVGPCRAGSRNVLARNRRDVLGASLSSGTRRRLIPAVTCATGSTPADLPSPSGCAVTRARADARRSDVGDRRPH